MSGALPSRCPGCARALKLREGRRCKFCGCLVELEEAPAPVAAPPRAPVSGPAAAPAALPPARAAAAAEFVPLPDDPGAPDVAAPPRRVPVDDPRFGVDRAAVEDAARDRFRRGVLAVGFGAGLLLFTLFVGRFLGRASFGFIALAVLAILRGLQLSISRGDGSPED